MQALSNEACKTSSPATGVTAGGHNSFNLANAALDDPEGDNIEEDIFDDNPVTLEDDASIGDLFLQAVMHKYFSSSCKASGLAQTDFMKFSKMLGTSAETVE